MLTSFEFQFSDHNKTRHWRRLSDEDKKKLDRLLKSHVRQARLYFKERYEALAPEGETGALKDALDVSPITPTKAGVGYEFTGGVPPINTGGSFDEALYPLYVEHGTKGPIFSPHGNVLTLRDKNSGRTVLFKNKVAGQGAQKYFARTVQATKGTFSDAIAMQRLKKQIAEIYSGY